MREDYVSRLAHDSEQFVATLDRHPALGRIIRGEADQLGYARFLVSTYQYVRWSGTLLAKTAEGLGKARRSEWLLAALELKSEEEAPHDRWVLEDLRQLGLNVELVKAETPSHAVLGYVHASLAWAENASPAFLGAAYTLEFISLRRAKLAADNLRAERRIPNIERAVSFLERHGEADVGHVAALESLLRRVDGTEDRAAILTAAALVRELFPVFFGRHGAAPSSDARDAA